MHRNSLIVSACLAIVPLSLSAQDATDKPAQQPAEKAVEEPETVVSAEDRALMDRVSVAYGTRMAQDLIADGIHLDPDKFAQAYKAIVAGGQPLMSEEEVQQTFGELREKLSASQGKEGKAFLEQNAKKEGVKVTESGLQYEVLKEGEGAKPAATDEVTVHYEGKLTNGEIFDSSIQRGEPTSFPLNRVIPGWTEGLQLMSPGAKYRFYIPHTLAYGEQGAPPRIPGFSTLIFEVELISVGAAPAQQ